jgi:hypothetical protein
LNFSIVWAVTSAAGPAVNCGLLDQPLFGFFGQLGSVWSWLDDLADVVRLAGQDVRAGVAADSQRAARQRVDASLG